MTVKKPAVELPRDPSMVGTYWYGPDDVDRRIRYSSEFNARKAELQANGDDTERRINAVWTAYRSIYPDKPEKPQYSSGWRPSAINEATSHAAKKSTHLDANAGDVTDDTEGSFAWWCQTNPGVLERHQLWMEHPVATVIRAKKDKKTPWCHLQKVSTKSGMRCYFPDADAIALWDEVNKPKSQVA